MFKFIEDNLVEGLLIIVQERKGEREDEGEGVK